MMKMMNEWTKAICFSDHKYIIYLCIAYFVTPGEQFRRLKFGDRYFYTHTVSKYFDIIKRAGNSKFHYFFKCCNWKLKLKSPNQLICKLLVFLDWKEVYVILLSKRCKTILSPLKNLHRQGGQSHGLGRVAKSSVLQRW